MFRYSMLDTAGVVLEGTEYRTDEIIWHSPSTVFQLSLTSVIGLVVKFSVAIRSSVGEPWVRFPDYAMICFFLALVLCVLREFWFVDFGHVEFLVERGDLVRRSRFVLGTCWGLWGGRACHRVDSRASAAEARGYLLLVVGNRYREAAAMEELMFPNLL